MRGIAFLWFSFGFSILYAAEKTDNIWTFLTMVVSGIITIVTIAIGSIFTFMKKKSDNKINSKIDEIKLSHKEYKLTHDRRHDLADVKLDAIYSHFEQESFKYKFESELKSIYSYNIKNFQLNSRLATFMQKKCEKFDDVCKDLISYGLADDSKLKKEIILQEIKDGAEDVYKDGVEILGEKFIKGYYLHHQHSTDKYIKNISELATSEENESIKKARFMKCCLEFKESFLSSLLSFYIENSDKIKES